MERTRLLMLCFNYSGIFLVAGRTVKSLGPTSRFEPRGDEHHTAKYCYADTAEYCYADTAEYCYAEDDSYNTSIIQYVSICGLINIISWQGCFTGQGLVSFVFC